MSRCSSVLSLTAQMRHRSTSFSHQLQTFALKALANSTALPHAGDWLNVVPSKALGLHLQDWEFRLCLQYWLGLRMLEEGARCPICQGASDAFGDHQVGCGGNGDRIHRHDAIRHVLFSAAQAAALAPWKGVPSLIPGSSSRPADVYLPNWKGGQPAAIDVTVISTLQQQTQTGAANTPGHTLTMAEERKMAAHAEACHVVGILFIPLAAETLGALSREAIDTIASIGRIQGQAFLHLNQSDTCSSAWPLLCGREMPTLWIRWQPVRPATVDRLI